MNNRNFYVVSGKLAMLMSHVFHIDIPHGAHWYVVEETALYADAALHDWIVRHIYHYGLPYVYDTTPLVYETGTSAMSHAHVIDDICLMARSHTRWLRFCVLWSGHVFVYDTERNRAWLETP